MVQRNQEYMNQHWILKTTIEDRKEKRKNWRKKHQQATTSNISNMLTVAHMFTGIFYAFRRSRLTFSIQSMKLHESIIS